MPKKLQPLYQIRLLVDMLNNDEGDEIDIVQETKNAVYFYDGEGRWCYFDKSEEGLFYERME